MQQSTTDSRAHHKKKQQTKQEQTLYLKSLSIWSDLRNLTMDPVYEVWITLEKKAILHMNKMREKRCSSYLSAYIPQSNNQHTCSLNSSTHLISWTAQCILRILLLLRRKKSIFKHSCYASEEIKHLLQLLLLANTPRHIMWTLSYTSTDQSKKERHSFHSILSRTYTGFLTCWVIETLI